MYARDKSKYDMHAHDESEHESDAESEIEETWFGECHQVFSGYRKVTLEPTYPPTSNMKHYLDALWKFEEERRRALEVKAAVKSVLRRLPTDILDRICVKVSRHLELQQAVRAAELSAARDAALYKTEAVYREIWYNPAEPRLNEREHWDE